jgi:hypothetical protein
MEPDAFAWQAVSTRVNNPRNDGPELLETISGQATGKKDFCIFGQSRP